MLGDIVVTDVDVGNSLPVLSNPKLASISVDGDMMIEMDIEYTGGVRIEARTIATLSVPAWVRLLCLIKGQFHETNHCSCGRCHQDRKIFG